MDHSRIGTLHGEEVWSDISWADFPGYMFFLCEHSCRTTVLIFNKENLELFYSFQVTWVMYRSVWDFGWDPFYIHKGGWVVCNKKINILFYMLKFFNRACLFFLFGGLPPPDQTNLLVWSLGWLNQFPLIKTACGEFPHSTIFISSHGQNFPKMG